jgi:hypothetical protein
MRGTGVELACFYWVAPPEEAGHRLAFLGHHHERDRRAEAPRAQTIPATRSKRFCARSFERSPSRGSVRARAFDGQLGDARSLAPDGYPVRRCITG